MKKLSFIIFSILVVFSACNKDDDPKPNARMTNEVEKDTFYVYTSEGNSMFYEIIWNIYTDEDKKNLVGQLKTGAFQDSSASKKFWFPISGAGNLKGDSYWIEKQTKRGPDGKVWYSDLKGSYHAQGFGWWEEDDKIYTK